jgi:sugar lactone lactonase YvrE
MGIEPNRWQPLKAPVRAKRKTGAEPFPPLDVIPLPGTGPEDVVVQRDGTLLAGLGDGRIVRIDPATKNVTTVGDTRGRPLGLEPLPDGRVLVCDSHRGLLRLDPATHDIEPLVEGLRFCSNAVAAADGTIYFTESTTRYGFEEYRSDLLEHSCTGRLFRRDPDGTVTTLLDGLAFANGVAFGPDKTTLTVAETAAYRLIRYDLKTQQASTLADNLPGFPDNISRGANGVTWVAIPNPRDARLDALLPCAPWLRKVVAAVPERLQPQPTRTTWVLGVDDSGTIVRDLQGPGTDYAFVTGVAEHDGRLYLGSITEPALGVLDLRRNG